MTSKVCCLTLDLENDCGGRVGLKFDTINKLNIALLVKFITEHNVPLTIFVTGKAIESKPEEIAQVQVGIKQCEFGLHSHTHTNGLDDYSKEILLGSEAYKNYFQQEPKGYRGPQGKVNEIDLMTLSQNGFHYDASIFPTVRPGLFNNLDAPITPYWLKDNNLVEIPGTVLPIIKIPYGLGYFRLLGKSISALLLKLVHHPDLLVLNFHLHDVFPSHHREGLKGFGRFLYYRNVNVGFDILSFAIRLLKKRGYQFILMNDVYEDFIKTNNTNA